MFLREKLSKDYEYKALSLRQLDVLRCTWDGLDSKATAERLNVSVKGVEFHRHNMVKMWRCDNIMQVIRLALRRRILEV